MRSRSFAFTLIAAVLASVAFAAEPAKPEAKRPVLAPHYGDTLFHFFQDKYFSAVTGLMVSQHFVRLNPHDDDGEILRGGLLLSYGMHREAGQIFAQLIERGAPPSVSDRAWYYLAKIRWQRGLNAESEEAIARIGGKLAAPLEEDRGLLHANLLMARGEFKGAAEVLRGMTADAKNPSQASFYARHNLGVALVKAGDPAGAALLDEVGRMPSATEEQRSLRDRANVAIGFAALQAGRTDDARLALQRVRLQSLHANKALLGFGWAAAQAKKPDQALVPWTELAGRSVSDAARARSAHRAALRLRRTGRLRAVAARLRGRGDPVRHRAGRAQGIDRRDHQRQAGRRPERQESGRGDGLVLEPDRAARDAARRPPDAGAGPSTTSRSRSRTTATCSSSAATWPPGATTWAPTATCWPSARSVMATACRAPRTAPCSPATRWRS